MCVRLEQQQIVESGSLPLLRCLDVGFHQLRTAWLPLLPARAHVVASRRAAWTDSCSPTRCVLWLQVGDLSCVELESRGVLQAAVGRDGGGIMLFDLAAGRPTGKASNWLALARARQH